MKSKLYRDAHAALEGLAFDGITVMAGGFGLCGIPENLIVALRDSAARDLTVIELPQDRAELQSNDGHRRQGHGCGKSKNRSTSENSTLIKSTRRESSCSASSSGRTM